jgi:hypothetical protein
MLRSDIHVISGPTREGEPASPFSFGQSRNLDVKRDARIDQERDAVWAHSFRWQKMTLSGHL